MYNPEILKKPAMLLINKMDTENAKKIFDEVKEKLSNINGMYECNLNSIIFKRMVMNTLNMFYLVMY